MIVHITFVQVTALSDNPNTDHTLCEELDIPNDIDPFFYGLQYLRDTMEADGTIRRAEAFIMDGEDERYDSNDSFHIVLTTPREACRVAAMLDYQRHTHGHICDDDGACADGVLMDDDEGRVYEGD